YPGGVTPAGQQVTHTGTPSGSFVVTTGAAGSGYPDMDVRQFSDNTFATQIGGHDNDRGASNSEETPYGSPLTATVDLTNNINLEFHEVGGADFTPSITFGYEVFDISSATHRTDFFSFNSLASGTTFSAEVLTDQATFGFFDSRLTFYNSAGTQISTHDSDAGTGAHELVTGVVVPGDGILIVEVNNSKSTNGIVGTYNLAVSGTAVPEPTSSALLGLGGLALILRRRK
ncbi:MAG: PEP-CTERM sorting domain-containing protein, partial [Akkermansiaceae bacterium]